MCKIKLKGFTFYTELNTNYPTNRQRNYFLCDKTNVYRKLININFFQSVVYFLRKSILHTKVRVFVYVLTLVNIYRSCKTFARENLFTWRCVFIMISGILLPIFTDLSTWTYGVTNTGINPRNSCKQIIININIFNSNIF